MADGVCIRQLRSFSLGVLRKEGPTLCEELAPWIPRIRTVDSCLPVSLHFYDTLSVLGSLARSPSVNFVATGIKL